MAASWELTAIVFSLDELEVCAEASTLTKQTSKQSKMTGETRRDILQFFYAVPSVKSNELQSFSR